MKSVLSLATMCALAVLSIGPVRAEDIGTDASDCARKTGATQLAACTYIIEQRDILPTPLAAALVNRSKEYLVEKKYQEALADLNRAIHISPDLNAAYVNRIAAYLGLKQYDKALEDANHAVAADRSGPEKFATILGMRATVRLSQRKWQEALEDIDRAISLKPGDADLLCRRGLAKAGLKNPTEAIADYKAALAINAADECSIAGLGQTYVDIDDFANAIAVLAGLTSNDPFYASAYNSRCWSRAVLNRELDKALADCELSLTLEPNVPGTLDSRGFVHFRMKDDKDAIADYTAAIALNPKLASSYFMRGLAKHRSGDPAGGDGDIAAAKAIDPKIAETYAGYGVTP